MKSGYQLIDRDSRRLIVSQLEIAATWWRRFVGCQFREHPGRGFGLLLVPCHSVHTCFLRFPLDIALLDQTGHVVGIRLGVRPWRAILPVKGAFAVVEVPSGTTELESGQRLQIVTGSGEPIPKLLQAMS